MTLSCLQTLHEVAYLHKAGRTTLSFPIYQPANVVTDTAVILT